VEVASVGAWATELAVWGESTAVIGASAAGLLGVPVAVATMAVADYLDPNGRMRTGLNLPEPVREFAYNGHQ
jgi:hypothetical protein